MKTLQEILKRKAELRSLLQGGKCENLDAVETEIRELDEAQAEIEKRNAIIEKLGTGVSIIEKPEQRSVEIAEEDIVSSKEYRSAYLRDLQGLRLTAEEERALTTASNSVGSAVPTETLNKIIEKLTQESVVLPLVTVLRIPSNVSMPVEGTNNNASVVAQGTASTDSADTIGKISLTAYKLIKTISITAEVKAMSIDAFEAFIVAQLVKKIKALVDYLIINGSGTGEPTGILTALTGDGNAIQTASTDGFTYEDLMTLLGKLKSGYAKGAVIMAKRSFIYRTIASLKGSDGHPIFKMETDGNFEGKLLGYPVVANDDVPDNKVIFGDFAFYFFNFVQDPQVEADKSVDFRNGNICYRAMALGDGNVGLNEAFVVMSKKS